MLEVRINSQEAANLLLRRLSRRALRPLALSSMRAALDLLADEVRSRCPVDTGALRDSIEVAVRTSRNGAVRGRVVVGGNDAEGATYYAFFLEFGTARMAAKPFLRPAVDAARSRVQGLLARRILSGIARRRG